MGTLSSIFLSLEFPELFLLPSSNILILFVRVRCVFEGWSAYTHAEEENPDRKNIHFLAVERLFISLWGFVAVIGAIISGVVALANDVAHFGGYAEVDQLDVELLIYEYVLEFDISVGDVIFFQIMKPLQYFDKNVFGYSQRQPVILSPH